MLITGQLLPHLQQGSFLALLVAVGCPHPGSVPGGTPGWGRMFVAPSLGSLESASPGALLMSRMSKSLGSSAPARQGREMPHVQGSCLGADICNGARAGRRMFFGLAGGHHGSPQRWVSWQSPSVLSTGCWRLCGAAACPARLWASTASLWGSPHLSGGGGKGKHPAQPWVSAQI